MSSKSPISVIVVTRNRPHQLIECLKSLKKNTCQSFELIIVDQSTDPHHCSNKHQLISFLKKFPHSIYLKQNKKGKSKGLNLAIKHSHAAILAFTDDDCILDKNWLTNILKTFEKHPHITAVFGKTLPYQPHLHPRQTCPCTFSYADDKSHLIAQPVKHWERIGFGNNMAWQKNFFDKYGLFKEWLGPGSFGSNAEDAEISLRALRNKEKIFYNPQVVTYHNKWLTKEELAKQFQSYKQGELFCYGYFALKGERIGRLVIKDNLNKYLSRFRLFKKI